MCVNGLPVCHDCSALDSGSLILICSHRELICFPRPLPAVHGKRDHAHHHSDRMKENIHLSWFHLNPAREVKSQIFTVAACLCAAERSSHYRRAQLASAAGSQVRTHECKYIHCPTLIQVPGFSSCALKDTYRRRQMQRTITRQMSFDLTKLLVTEDWFSDISPQTMRRLLNIVSITGGELTVFCLSFSPSPSQSYTTKPLLKPLYLNHK